MRVKEPLNGFRKAQGHIIFHIAMLTASYLIINYERDSKGPEEGCVSIDMKNPEDVRPIIQMIRAMHSWLIASQFIRLLMDCDENDLLVKLLRVSDIFFYIGTILYQQFFVLQFPPVKCEDLFVFFSKSWMMLELFTFYSLVLNAAIFLAYIQFRGYIGRKSKFDN